MPLIPVTLNALTDNSTPISSARASVWTEDYSSCVFDGYTDTGGQLVFALDPGIYKLFLNKTDIVFSPLPMTIELIEDPAIISFFGVPQTFPTESNGTVYLYGDIKDLTMNPISSAKIQIYLTNNPQTKNRALLDKSIREVYTDGNGRWGTLLPAGSLVTFVVLNSNFKRTGTLPFTGRINVLDLT